MDKEGIPLEGDFVSDLDTEPVGQIDWPLPERNTAHHMHALYGAGAVPMPNSGSSMSVLVSGPSSFSTLGGDLASAGPASMGHAYSAGDLVATAGGSAGTARQVRSFSV
jgi:hypothetical protein